MVLLLSIVCSPQIGVSDADARQRVLGAVLNVHKQEWKMLSHATLPHGRSLRCVVCNTYVTL